MLLTAAVVVVAGATRERCRCCVSITSWHLRSSPVQSLGTLNAVGFTPGHKRVM